MLNCRGRKWRFAREASALYARHLSLQFKLSRVPGQHRFSGAGVGIRHCLLMSFCQNRVARDRESQGSKIVAWLRALKMSIGSQQERAHACETTGDGQDYIAIPYGSTRARNPPE